MKLQKKLLKIARETAKEIYANQPVRAIYLKGSVVRDEVDVNSDVDLVAILDNSKPIKKIKAYEDELVHVATYTVSELKRGVNNKNNKHTPARVTNMHLEHFLLLEGDSIEHKTLPKVDISKRFPFIITHTEKTIQSYKNRKCGFVDVIKQTLWLAHYQLMFEKGLNIYKWEEVVNQYPKSHIYQKVWKYRYRENRPKKRGKIETNFIKKVEEYINGL